MKINKQQMNEIFTEANPMTDLLFICIFCFGLMFTVARFNVHEPQEKALPDVELSQLGNVSGGANANSELSITMRKEGPDVQFFLNDELVARQDLADKLDKYAGCARVAIRRDSQITTGLEDEVIAACAASGIRSIALIVKQSGGTEQ